MTVTRPPENWEPLVGLSGFKKRMINSISHSVWIKNEKVQSFPQVIHRWKSRIRYLFLKVIHNIHRSTTATIFSFN